MMSVMNLVRSAISASHFQIEQTAFSKGMLDGSMTATNYSRGLVQLWHIHGTLESCATSCPEVTDFFTREMVRTETIRRDLQAFGFNTDSFAPMIETIAIVEQMKDWALESPYAILGCIYILEGSRMGSLMIAKPLGKSLGLTSGDVAGIEYHTEGAAGTPMRLRSFKENVDQANLGAAAETELIQGAVRFMDLLNTLYAALPMDSLPKQAQQLKTA
jgi:heme oxygenase (biliverdin-producing, ferredoxin)